MEHPQINPTPTPNSPAPVDIARLRELLRPQIQRFELTEHYRGMDCWHEMEENEEGDYVLYWDIAALRNAAPALLDEVTQLREQVKCLVHNWQGQITRTNAERDKLREEVAELRPKLTRECENHDATARDRDSLRQQNEQLLKEIEELRARPTGLWKENY